MTNTEWRNAPWNQPEPVYDTCPDCNGDGGDYFNNNDVISKADYERLSDEDKASWKFDRCLKCNGSGEIEVERYEPDYDDYDK